MQKIIVLILSFVMVLTLVACGSNNESNTASTTITTIPSLESTSVSPFSPFGEGHSITASQFWANSSKVSGDTYAVLTEFSRNPQITEEFLQTMYTLNDKYTEQTDVYYSVLLGEETGLYLQEFLEIQREIQGYSPKPMLEINYDDTWINGVSAQYNYSTDSWEPQYSHRYADGLYEISEGVFCYLKWSQNIENAVDADNDEEVYRAYRVTDPTKDAYLLLWGVETSWQLVRIIADK